MSPVRAIACALVLLLALPEAQAAAEPDRKVGKHLDKRKVRYDVDSEGAIEVTVSLADELEKEFTADKDEF